MKSKTFFILNAIVILFFSQGTIFAQNDESKISEYENLFKKYQQNNTEYQKAVFELEQSKLALQKSKIDNGFNFSLSTGTTKTEFSGDGVNFSMEPQFSVGAANLNNTSISVEVPYSVDQVGEKAINDASVVVSTDVFSSTSKKSKLAIEKANRNVLQARRDLQNTTVEVHTAFLNELKTLYSDQLEILEAEDDMLDDLQEFETVKAKGYAENSAKYRTAKLEWESSERTVQEKKRTYEANLAVFASKCSMEVGELNLDFALPDVELAKFDDFAQKNFKKIESANWDLYINKKERAIDTTKSLSAQAGYGFSTSQNSDVVLDDGAITEIENSLKAGASLELYGVTLSALANIPVDSNAKPSVTMSLAWDPFSAKSNALSKKSDEYSTKIDELAILDAKEDYKTSKIEMDENRQNLDWKIVQYKTEVELYAELENDTSTLYEKGLVAESEYRKAKINLASAKAKLSEAKIERLLYNDQIVQLFNPQDEGDISSEKSEKNQAKSE